MALDFSHLGSVIYRIIPQTISSFLPEDHDPVGVGAGRHVIHSPDIRGLGEVLLIDDHTRAVKAGSDTERHDMLLEPDRTLPHFAYLECHKAPFAGDTKEFIEHRTHDTGPFLKGPCHRDVSADPLRIEPVEPAAEPVVIAVLHDIEERRRSNRELDGLVTDLRRAPCIPGQQDGFFPGICQIFYFRIGYPAQQAFCLGEDDPVRVAVVRYL